MEYNLLVLLVCSAVVFNVCSAAPTSDFEADRQKFVELAREIDETVQKLETDIDIEEKGKKCEATYCRPGGAIVDTDVDTEQEPIVKEIPMNDNTESDTKDNALRDLLETLLKLKSERS